MREKIEQLLNEVFDMLENPITDTQRYSAQQKTSEVFMYINKALSKIDILEQENKNLKNLNYKEVAENIHYEQLFKAGFAYELKERDFEYNDEIMKQAYSKYFEGNINCYMNEEVLDDVIDLSIEYTEEKSSLDNEEKEQEEPEIDF